MSDPLMQALAGLPDARPDSVRTDRVRERCLERLTRTAPAHSRPAAPRPRAVWRPIGAALGVTYLAALLSQALRVYGLR